jgi:hypothetical protein
MAGLNPTGFDWRYQGTPEGIRIRWFGEVGRSYAIERSLDLRKWVAAGTLAGTGNLLEFGDRKDTDRMRFYRVRIAP